MEDTSKMTKSQLKRYKVKMETLAINAKRAKASEAEEIEDQLEILPIFKVFNRNGLRANIVSHKHAPEELQHWIFELCKNNMFNYYENSNGWDDNIKRHELFEDRARYLIAYVDEKPIAYVHYRFEFDQGELIVYVYELHVEEAHRNKGLGKFMVQAIEMIALKRGMELVMLTLFKEDEGAVRLFRRMNYQLHNSSPEMIDPEEAIDCFYSVYWKPLIKPKTQ